MARTLGLSLPLSCLVVLGAASVPAGDPSDRWMREPDAGVVPASFPSPIPVAELAPDSGAQPPAAGPDRPPEIGKQPIAAASGGVGQVAPIPLSPPNASRRAAQAGAEPRADGGASLVTTIGSLAVVLGVFFVVVWIMRRMAPAGSAPLPGEVLEVLGRAVVAQRQQVHLLRCGKKLLLVASSPAGMETLTEITEPEEVDRLAGLCRQAQPGSTTNAFRQILEQFSGERGRPGLSGGGPEDRVDLSVAGLPR